MSAHESYSTLVNSRAPRLAPGATTQSYQTWCSASAELAAPHAPPNAVVLSSRAHGQRGKEDRASILDRIIVFGVAAIFGVIGAGSLIVGVGYWFI